jgi:DNA-directed RNA polymerase subunit RPC12/RpoP
MAFLDKLMHRPAQVDCQPCSHLELAPQFETQADADDEAKATSYRCSSCGQVFEPGQAFLMQMKNKARTGSQSSKN